MTRKFIGKSIDQGGGVKLSVGAGCCSTKVEVVDAVFKFPYIYWLLHNGGPYW